MCRFIGYSFQAAKSVIGGNRNQRATLGKGRIWEDEFSIG